MSNDGKRHGWRPGMSFESAVEEIEYVRSLAREMGGSERVQRQHKGGRLTIRERIERLIDPGSFIEGGVAAAYKREIQSAADPDARRREIEERLLRLRSPFRAAHQFDVIDLIDPRETRRLACTFVKLSQPALERLSRRPKRAVRP